MCMYKMYHINPKIQLKTKASTNQLTIGKYAFFIYKNEIKFYKDAV